jgi:alpha-glucosidase
MHVRSRNAPDIGLALATLREAAGDALLVGEVYQPTERLGPYLEHVDVAFAFELFHAPWNAEAMRAAVAQGASEGAAWVLSNHDFPRLPTRVGAGNERAAALLALTLPGPVFVYQGDEIGMPDGPGGDPPVDRAGRDGFRHPMRWSDAEAHGGFTTGTPWLPAIGVPAGGVAEQSADPASLLALYRDLVALRRDLRGPVELVEAAEGVLAYRRGDALIAMNLADSDRPAPAAGPVRLDTHRSGASAPASLGPGEGFVANATG